MRFARLCVITLASAIVPIIAYGQDATTQPAVTTQPTVTAQPEAAAPASVAATQPSDKVSAEAQTLLDQMRDAYGKATSIHMAGKFTADIDVAGTKEKHTAAFDSVYQSPNKFQQTTTGETPEEAMTLGSTGEKLYIYNPSEKQYVSKDAPKERGAGKDHPFARILLMQNPAMLFALSSDAGQEALADSSVMTGGGSAPGNTDPQPATGASLGADEKIGDTNFRTLNLTTGGSSVSMLVDPATHMVRRVTVDLKDMLTRRGQADVKNATLNYDYTSTDLNPTTKPDQFAWTPPEGSKDLAQAAKEQQDDEEKAAMALQGKAAPDFKLTGLDDKPVTLADVKGSVVVLDFWATWCGPCKASLPALDQTAKDYAGKGVKVYAVNVREDKAQVSAFVKETSLGLSVLLDPNGDASDHFGVNGIPQTVIIGKDGVVRKVLIGFEPGATEKTLRAELDAALGQ